MSAQLPNSSILTQQHKAWSLKKKIRGGQVKEVIFDDAARLDYLTGFHKRKLQKKEAAKTKAIEREKQEKLQDRRERRKELAERAKKNHEEVERAYGGLASESEQEGASMSMIKKGKKKEDVEVEYEDEEQMATVTIVEEFDMDDPTSTGSSNQLRPQDTFRSQSALGRKVVRDSGGSSLVKKERPKKFAYETHAARKASRKKETSRKHEKASVALRKPKDRSSRGKGKRR